MDEKVLRELDGYNEIRDEIAISRKFGFDYTIPGDDVDQYVERLHPPMLDLIVSRVIEETPSSKTIRLVSEYGYLPPFQAGQYITVIVEKDNVRTTRPYSISSSPDQLAYYDITVRRIADGLISGFLVDELKTGDKIQSSAPSGNFLYNPVIHDNKHVYVAGGSGITPFMSMLRQVTDRRLKREVYLFYGNRNDEDILFHDELVDISNQSDTIQYIPVIEKPGNTIKCETGLITAELITSRIGALHDKTFFMCGPTAMYDFCRGELDNLDIPLKKIRTEMYGMPENITAYPGWPETIKNEQEFEISVIDRGVFKGKAGNSILKTLELNGLRVPSLCRSGECSLCRVKLVSGKVFQPEGVLLRKSDRKYGYIHSCAAFPLSDVELEI